ncbi:uncharacterized protein EKO05_0008470 [Ascochyta rabiei]|uniref:uncharacterized protein n=1 Tax=Didymella rabiei TaxID=5454 RepID=UPI002205B89C|nr:uncharacterized protein EKO05_0008470 [Ascochyta rabiei]UPX18160.1 hypothetical protein EKO05_0008470 [Ascochyta rabiei]
MGEHETCLAPRRGPRLHHDPHDTPTAVTSTAVTSTAVTSTAVTSTAVTSTAVTSTAVTSTAVTSTTPSTSTVTSAVIAPIAPIAPTSLHALHAHLHRRPPPPPPPSPSPPLPAAPIPPSDSIDAWLECLTRASAASQPGHSARCTMADAEDAPTIPPPAPNPDAQTTVNDFLDYTDFYPSDLVRSLTLIGDLDAAYADAVQQVHELAALYCTLPALPAAPESERPDPAALRKQIARHLHTAITRREYAYTEAARLYEVTLRHCQRSTVIKRKLQAQPEPPSRDPTPPPVSPHALKRTHDRPRLHLTFDGARHKHRNPAIPLPPRRSHPDSASASDSDSDSASEHSDDARRISLAERPRKAQTYKDRAPRPRPRAPGVAGTNVHSSIAGISTSNALAKLSPPPPDARPGSKWAPWMKLTEYEMAVLRKQMKKNAVWTPSLTMVNRELERKHRTKGDYERERARCHVAGETLVDEEPETLLQIATAQGVDDPALTATAHAAEGFTAPGESAPAPAPAPASTPARDDSVEAADGRRPDRNTRRQQAMRAVRALENATKTIQNAADGLKELTFSPHAVSTPPASAQRKRSTARTASNKRKRDTTPSLAADSAAESTKGAEAAELDAPPQQPEPKRPRLQLIAPAPPPPDRAMSTPAPASADVSVFRHLSTPLSPSSAAQTPEALPEAVSNTVQVPLAPAGPSTPRPNKAAADEASPQATPVHSPPAELKRSSSTAAVPAPVQAPAPSATTAAVTRSRRESVAAKNSSPPPSEPSAPARALTPALERAASPEPTVALRPRPARSHVLTPKALSEEPKPIEAGQPTRDTRRHSIFSQSALTAPAPIRVSLRKKPPPKGEVSSAENGQKTVTNVKRSQGSKHGKRKKLDDQPGHVDDVDSDEERYCICDDVSYGQMISCDNNCDKEWFHFECVGMTQMPARRAKWYCPDCREALGTDAFGNPKVPPALPGRTGRGNLSRGKR